MHATFLCPIFAIQCHRPQSIEYTRREVKMQPANQSNVKRYTDKQTETQTERQRVKERDEIDNCAYYGGRSSHKPSIYTLLINSYFMQTNVIAVHNTNNKKKNERPSVKHFNHEIGYSLSVHTFNTPE